MTSRAMTAEREALNHALVELALKAGARDAGHAMFLVQQTLPRIDQALATTRVDDDAERMIFEESVKRGVDQDTADQIAQAVANRLALSRDE